MDKLTSMQVFTRVAKLGSFAAASDELDISRAMVSKHVKQLENSLGIRLFNRTTRRISLTEVGTAYLQRCLHILDDIEETEQSVTQLQTEPRGTLKIHSAPYFGTRHLVPAIADYLERYPDVRFDLVLQGGVADIIEEGFDLSIRLDDLADSSLIARKVATSRLILCAAPRYLERHGEPNSPEELKTHNCLVNWSLPPRDLWTFTNQQSGRQSQHKASGTVVANVAGVARIAALNGIGLTILPTYMIGEDLKSGALRPLMEAYQLPSLTIHATYPHRRHLSAKVRTFVDFLCERMQPTPYWEEWKG